MSMGRRVEEEVGEGGKEERKGGKREKGGKRGKERQGKGKKEYPRYVDCSS